MAFFYYFNSPYRFIASNDSAKLDLKLVFILGSVLAPKVASLADSPLTSKLISTIGPLLTSKLELPPDSVIVDPTSVLLPAPGPDLIFIVTYTKDEY